MLLTTGVSFTAFTVRTKVSAPVNVPSLTVTVTVLVPFWFAAGLIVSVHAHGKVPDFATFTTGKSVVLLLVTLIDVEQWSVVSTSAIR